MRAGTLANNILSFSSDKDDPTESEIVVGLPNKPKVNGDLKISIEFLFLNGNNAVVGMDKNKVDVLEVKIETTRVDWTAARLVLG